MCMWSTWPALPHHVHVMLPQDGVSPLFIASCNNHEEVVKLLLTAGANPDATRPEVRGIGLVDGVFLRRWQLMIRCVQLHVGVPITHLKLDRRRIVRRRTCPCW